MIVGLASYAGSLAHFNQSNTARKLGSNELRIAALDDPSAARQRTAMLVEPQVIGEPGAPHDERIGIPFAGRISGGM
jgi:hypothetical protein